MISSATCPECDGAVGRRVFQGDVPFDGKHTIDVTNEEGARLVVHEGVVHEYALCGHLFAEEPFPTIVECDQNVRNMDRGRERGEAMIAAIRAAQGSDS